MLNTSRQIPGGEWKLSLEFVLAELISDGLITKAQARELNVGSGGQTHRTEDAA